MFAFLLPFLQTTTDRHTLFPHLRKTRKMSPAREDFNWQADVDTSLTDPKDQIKVSVFEGKLTVVINGDKQ